MKILLMGCGGIGSWFASFLAFGIRNYLDNADVTVADGDVVEEKNLLYSNFDVFDVGKNKARVIGDRYKFEAIPRFIKRDDDFRGFDLVVIATDDGKTRKFVYDASERLGFFWIDLRCKGRGFAVFAKGGKPTVDMVATVDIARDRESCQDAERLDLRKVDCGNVVAAALGYQLMLNYLRDEFSVKDFRGWV